MTGPYRTWIENPAPLAQPGQTCDSAKVVLSRGGELGSCALVYHFTSARLRAFRCHRHGYSSAYTHGNFVDPAGNAAREDSIRRSLGAQSTPERQGLADAIAEMLAPTGVESVEFRDPE